MTKQEAKARKEIFKKVSDYYRRFHGKPAFKPGESFVNYGGRVYDDKEMVALTDTALDFWLTSGRYCAEFEKELGKYLGVKYVSLVNSGSSANLVAFMALTSPKLGARRIKPGDEVITVAAGFPTTVTPIIQYGAVPVFVDVSLPSYNIDCALLEKARSRRTKAVMLAHTLGNPFDIAKVKKFCDRHGLWLIEDNCDALGSRYKLDGKWGFTGAFGHIGTSSFYPPHHMSCSKSTTIPYLDECGRWNLAPICEIYGLYAKNPNAIKVISFDAKNRVKWSVPSAILRHQVGSKKMVRIVSQHGREVEVTEDHSVFVLDRDTAQIVPRAAGAITCDDYVVAAETIPAPRKVMHVDVLNWFKDRNAYVSGFSCSNLKYVENPDARCQFTKRNTLPIEYLRTYDLGRENLSVGLSQSNKIPARLPINEQLCRLIGYFMAEGSYQAGLVFSFNRNEKKLISDIRGIVKTLFNLPVFVYEKSNSAVVKIPSKNIEIVFSEIFGIKKGAKNKRIPWIVYHSGESCVKAFIYGYTKGDGSFRQRPGNTCHIDVTSVSKDLLNDFQYLLSRVGISASFYTRNKGQKKKIAGKWTLSRDNYTLSFSGYRYNANSIVRTNATERNNFSLQIPLLDVFRKYISVSKGQKVVSRPRLAACVASNKELLALVVGDTGFFKVRSVEKIDYPKDEYVYDIAVPGRENFYGGFLGLFLHNTMGEGGAVYANDPLLRRLIESFRDWGRDCWCPSGKDNTCHNRFTRKYGELPLGYDHKYVYSHFGYNLKATEMQAAVGVAQLRKFPAFVRARRKNWAYLRKALDKFSGSLLLPEPTPKSDPSWFGFLITVRPGAGFTRDELVAHLEKNKVQTRMLFAGNLVKHPCFDEMREPGKGYRLVSKLENTDRVMNNTFWIGVYPGMTPEMLRYMAGTFRDFFAALDRAGRLG